MATVVTFTQADLDQMKQLGERKLANAERLGTPHVNRFRHDRIDGYVDGFRGEWAVRELLGLERRWNISGKADDGSDLTYRGERINTRFRRQVGGKLMCPANRPFHCHSIVLVVPGRDHLSVRVIGGISVERFYVECRRGDFGYGDTDYVDQRQLDPWDEFRRKLDEMLDEPV